MPEFFRVTDDVVPRREYTIPAISFIPGQHQKLDKPATALDGTPLPPKFTPEALVGPEAHTSYQDSTVTDLQDEVDRRNDGRPEDQQISKTGKKADLVSALEADDAAQQPLSS